jgi:ATP-dependent protease ClpP protease subunit
VVIAILALALGWLALAGQSVQADVLMLHDGRMLVGEATSDRRGIVVFRTLVDDQWVDLQFERTQVKQLYRDPGNQADAGSGDDREDGEPTGKPGRPVPARPAPDGALVVAVIPLHGQVGGLQNGSVRGTFDVQVLEHCLDAARDRGAELVILDIQSPGGFLLEMESICELILERAGEQRIVAWPGEALSAAAVIALSCREMVVRPNATVGAAVIVQEQPDGLTAVEAKLASPHHAKQRGYMQRSGRPHELLAAMTVQSRSLWWSPDAGFTSDAAVVASTAGFELVDGGETVLTMIASDARRWGLASGEAGTADGVAAALGIEQASILDLRADVQRFNDDLDRRVGNVLRQFRDYFLALSNLHELLGELQVAMDNGDDEAIKDGRRRVRIDLREARTSGESIQREDRDLIARRAQLPDALLGQFRIDAEAFDEINRLIRRPQGDGAGQSQRLTAEVLDAWMRLLS